MREISHGREELSLSYEGDFVGEEFASKEALRAAYLRLFTQNAAREIAAGMTLFGIHRDELTVTLSGLSAKDYASQGQQRSIVLALKMAEGMVCRELTGEAPVYLFDDVLSELDEGRRRFLLSGMRGCQFIVTGCDEKVLSEIEGEVKIIRVKDGNFEE
jgi:DNA replication and repair protein RecF